MTGLRDHLADLVSPVGIGDELLPGVRLTRLSTELGLRLTFDADGADVHIEIEPPLDDRPHAVSTHRLRLSYRTSERETATDPDVAMRVCRAVARAIAPNEDRVLNALASEAKRARESTDGPRRIREVDVSEILEPAGTPDERYYTLSPYVGCLIGCRFCYAQRKVGIVRRLEGLPEVAWGSYVDARINAPEVLARELEARSVLPIKFCPIVSDPYQAVERRYEITRRCLEAIGSAKRDFPTLILTRSTLVERDIDLIAGLAGPHVGISIPTIDDETRRHFEPRAAKIADRLNVLEAFGNRGVRTFAIVQPLLPGSVEELAAALADVVTSVRIDVLYGVEGAEEEFSHERYRVARSGAWQRSAAQELAEKLTARGVDLWPGELPPDLRAVSS